jgi:hypothetical protein
MLLAPDMSEERIECSAAMNFVLAVYFTKLSGSTLCREIITQTEVFWVIRGVVRRKHDNSKENIVSHFKVEELATQGRKRRKR